MARPYFNAAAYVLSRFAFVSIHLDILYWLNLLLNDPLHLGTNTLDPRDVQPASSCSRFIGANAIFDLQLFAVWWFTHSGLARKSVQRALGLFDHPIERPLYSAISCVVWAINLIYWKPISNCERWDPFSVSGLRWAVHGTVFLLGMLLLIVFIDVQFLDAVFGLSRHRYRPGNLPRPAWMPRGVLTLVRHPASAAFLWMYWSLPSYTANHVFLASVSTVFILVSVFVFIEGGINENDEFGRKYATYKKTTGSLIPRPEAVLGLVTSNAP